MHPGSIPGEASTGSAALESSRNDNARVKPCIGNGGQDMPQLWLTYGEIAAAFGERPTQVRAMTHAEGWVHKRSHDGLTRVLMPDDLMRLYLADRANWADRQTDAMVAELRAVLSKVDLADVLPPPRSHGRGVG